MKLDEYIDSVNKRYQAGNATEHTFRGDLQQLIETLVTNVEATNEPKRQKFGAPDYIITKNDIPVGYIEAKDIGDRDLEGNKVTGNKEQFDRYKAALNNIIFTDYLNFYLYRDGQFVVKVIIADITGSGIKALPENFDKFSNLINDFCGYVGQTIKSSKKLAEMMAGKAKLLSEIIENSITGDEINEANSTLQQQFEGLKDVLIHDITPKGFADVYAQTIAYGMLAARFHDATLPTFSRQEAAELIPKSNPFLRKLFGYIAGPEIDDRIKWIVDSLAEIFLACNVVEIFKNYGKSTKMEDPIIHFYETFLSEYDPSLRKERGVWYTPAPVVSFIVRAVDDVLKTEFGLPSGLADTSKTTIKVKTAVKATGDLRSKLKEVYIDREVHKVQILDPATGTGTFLAEVVKHIYKKYKGQKGIWSSYVESQLLPRLNGFELLMASYAMAHLQLDLLLAETGYKPIISQRLKIYLTNSLEEDHPDTGTLFAHWLSTEANEANHIKRDTPVMCILGNPPYNGESKNKGEWIMKLMEDYKKEPGGREKLKERNSKWLNDDYVKFIRYGQYYIEKNGSGVLAFINPHGFLDNSTFRGMRWSLLKTYDKIYTIDLHGNSNKKEVSEDGTLDMNLFNIQQGTSINIFIKTGNKKDNELGKVFHCDLYGKRDFKFDFLDNNSLTTIPYKEIPTKAPMYYMVQRDTDVEKEYENGFKINNLFNFNKAGIVTARDEFTIQISKEEVEKVIKKFLELDDEQARTYFKLGKDVEDWKVNLARKDLKESGVDFNNIVKITYRPFEDRYTYYTGKSKGFHCRPRGEVMRHMFKKDNIALICPKQLSDNESPGAFITRNIAGHKTYSAYNINNIFPLYLYPESKDEINFIKASSRILNLNTDIIAKIAKDLNLYFIEDDNLAANLPQGYQDIFYPLDILDYIYAIMHSFTYTGKYKEFLQTSFPIIPYPKDRKTFKDLAGLGRTIRQLHLLESPLVEDLITEYPVDGSNVIENIKYEDGNVFINETQYFSHIPQVAWDSYIGGYQPAQKWLKDRKDRKLDFDDILHYQKIIVALTETDRIMTEIDKIEIE
ncbi:type ISP restriction/modification enzyme [Spirosoma endbachense]|uniref:site-specific DNA-methyltransferase (adenine-specific) n=1 Tax=Spirosoma endbachense TaxID=2666025 RepID=A0A6P1W3D7_9BACT|nr:type ISP restriction/modification enzyme [Spirosoma endbachense]QHV99404.1 N-6 DNA methylase [Spirosoma endbachense]